MGKTDYRTSGVDIDAGNEAVRRVKALAQATYTSGVLSGVGAFGGLFELPGSEGTVLVASADGVGTKLRLAFMTGVHDTVGRDLVNHCVNDILAQGARPLFFLDYLSTGKLEPTIAEQIVSGIAAACRENGCALLGGETAEMPGFYADGEYDLAGFIVGSVARDRIVDGRNVSKGDQLIALPSSGLHTNGYSLARKIVFDELRLTASNHVDELGETVGEALLRPHLSYLEAVAPLLERGLVKGMAHITGGGITDNLPRSLPEGRGFSLDRGSWTPPPVFSWLRHAGGLDEHEAFRAFNMGVGFILVVAPDDVDTVMAALPANAWLLGHIT